MVWMIYSGPGRGPCECAASGRWEAGSVEIQMAITRWDQSESSASILAGVDWGPVTWVPVGALRALCSAGDEILNASRAAARLLFDEG